MKVNLLSIFALNLQFENPKFAVQFETKILSKMKMKFLIPFAACSLILASCGSADGGAEGAETADSTLVTPEEPAITESQTIAAPVDSTAAMDSTAN